MSKRRNGRRQTGKQRRQSHRDKGLIKQQKYTDIPQLKQIYTMKVKPTLDIGVPTDYH